MDVRMTESFVSIHLLSHVASSKHCAVAASQSTACHWRLLRE